ncbi:AKL10 [Puccinia graminis f. sp. tritici CRL 75-36-700-3]|uniref:AKL10 n=1 Tax=Puccinia graminis f. sp. tritici (strain CRL 75-36-700-3 / race SCCL) TaxID=418459 RepID=E3JZ88_PUCGT|nr:AKL10 [Puccinia graminis f. sp. tritici CRL 75-36-700-3]EFP77363.2 AKL10 [Puccinia graminis f. sp. tritici CRL 75-36-700-3]
MWKNKYAKEYMELFLEKHKCNNVCKALELPDLVEIPWVPPPSAPDNFANDLGHFCRATVNTAQSTSNNPQTACEISQSSRVSHQSTSNISQSTSNIGHTTGNTGLTNEPTPGPTDEDLGLISVVRLGTQALSHISSITQTPAQLTLLLRPKSLAPLGIQPVAINANDPLDRSLFRVAINANDPLDRSLFRVAINANDPLDRSLLRVAKTANDPLDRSLVRVAKTANDPLDRPLVRVAKTANDPLDRSLGSLQVNCPSCSIFRNPVPKKMTRNAQRRLLNANPSLKKGPLANGSPDQLVRRKAGNHQGESWPCVVRASSTQSKGPLAHGSPDLLVWRKAGNHQGESGSCVVSASSTLSKGPLAHGSPELLVWRKAGNHQGESGSCVVGASSEDDESEDDEPLWNHKPSRQIALSSGLVPHFILEYHSFQTSPSTPIFDKLCDVIQTLHAMARYRPHNKRNTQRLNGEMHLIGFRPGNDDGKSGGTYVRNTLTPAQTAEDDANWAKLQSHNNFLAGRMEALSRTAFLENQALMQEYGIPNWTQEEWTEMKNEDREHLKFAANVSVTYNDFYNQAHQDKNDLNGWTYDYQVRTLYNSSSSFPFFSK